MSKRKQPVETPVVVATPPTTTKPPMQYGMARARDLPCSPLKLAVLGALKLAGGVGANYVGSKAVMLAGKGAISDRNVRHYCYHAAAAGLVAIAPRGVGLV